MSTPDQTPFPKLGRRGTLRDVFLCIGMAALALVLVKGASLREAGEELDSGWQRTTVLVAGHPAGWISDSLPLADAADSATAWISPDDELSSADGEGFATVADSGRSPKAGVEPVTPDAFNPADLGVGAQRKPKLRKLLVTGDSLSQPLDATIARRLADVDVETKRDPRLGTAISKTELLDWGKLSRQQAADVGADAVVMFLGANEGFPMAGAGGGEVECCGPEWAALYATRARQMMNTYRRSGAARVYWLTVPKPREREREEIARAVNLALEKAAAVYGAQVRLLDTDETFAPGGRYSDAIDVGGRKQIVRESDGIHLNKRGSELAADRVLEEIRRDFQLGG
ncbi:MAG TPA: GDSL-type esterase/lipase family protein [Thermoleophilaceae bacterium]|nr:GDSL-type esterase/lipase family protein [Thermoleophilaceae bacterium]